MKIYSASTPPEAHIVCELLRSQSIECEVRGEGIFSLQGEVPFGENSEPYIWLLQPTQKKRACEIINQFKHAELGRDWLCTQCGETNESQFGVCWQCGEAAN